MGPAYPTGGGSRILRSLPIFGKFWNGCAGPVPHLRCPSGGDMGKGQGRALSKGFSEGEVCLDTKNEGAGIPFQEKVSERSFRGMATNP